MRAHRRFARCALAALGACALTAAAAHANLVTNGSFESGPDPGIVMTLGVGSTVMPGWTVTRDAIEYCGTCWEAANGTRSLALNGTSPGGVAQTLATIPGGEYTVRFFMIGDAFSNPIYKHMRVMAAGQFQDYEVDAGHAWPWGMGWLEKTFVFDASEASTLLEFMSLDAGDQGPTLDSVVVTLTALAGVPPGGAAVLLASPRPTPARDAVEFVFTLATEQVTRLSVHDLAGREVALVEAGVRPAGLHRVRWDLRGPSGTVSAGLYVVRLEAGGDVQTRKVVLAP